MWFHFFVGNHDEFGRRSLLDVMEWLVGSLTELGHEVTVGDRIAPNAMNIIWENFVDADEQTFKDCNFKFGLIATEIPAGKSYNWLNEEPWLTRRRSFDKIAPRAEFIWSLVEEPVNSYARWAPSGYLELGFLESITDPVFSREPDFDFGFYGLNITGYRGEVLQRLRKHFNVVAPDRFLAGAELNTFIASSKIGICLKHSQKWTIPSPGRIGRLLHAKRGIAAQYVPLQSRASTFAPMADKNEDFVEFCLECLSGPWKQRAEDAYERFRVAMPMTQIMERLLDETVSKSSAISRAGTLASSDDRKRDWLPFAREMPRLIHSESGYNFLIYAGHVYAIDQTIGRVDLTLQSTMLVDRFGPTAVIVAQTMDEARSRVAALSKG